MGPVGFRVSDVGFRVWVNGLSFVFVAPSLGITSGLERRAPVQGFQFSGCLQFSLLRGQVYRATARSPKLEEAPDSSLASWMDWKFPLRTGLNIDVNLLAALTIKTLRTGPRNPEPYTCV